MAGSIIVFSAASGAGKSTVLSELKNRIPELVYSISSTTRSPRGDEKDGVEYFFLTKNEFSKKIDENDFVEWAEVHGNYYGTSLSFINEQMNSGKTVVMDIDVQGKVLLDKKQSETKGIFIDVPSADELERRLRSRGTDSEEDIKIRLENAVEEQEFARFEGKYNYYIVNDNLDICVDKIERTVRLIMSQAGEQIGCN
jgi:guanylate kinase